MSNGNGQLRIGFDGFRISGQPFGIGRYIEYMLKHWNHLLVPNEKVLIYVKDQFDAKALGLSDAFEVRHLPSRLSGVWWEHLVLASRWREMDVLFGPSYTVPLNFKGRSVVATHSVNEAQRGAHSLWYDLTYRQRNKLCARKADAVIVPSEAARDQVIDVYGVAPEKISIVAEGVDDSFQPIDDEEVLEQTRRRFFGDDRPYILFVGKFSQRRNIPALITAFANVKRSKGIPHGLLLYGKNVHDLPLDSLVSELGVADSVVQLNEPLQRHEDIIPVYSAADAYVHPSEFEGFSLTICEAMACGTPVITTGRGAAQEIVDGAGLLVDAPTPEALTEALDRLLADSSLASALREKGLERVRRFRMEEMARGTLDVLRSTAGA
jgi:glycosyltransferase involved in cell wall biosynthesis